MTIDIIIANIYDNYGNRIVNPVCKKCGTAMVDDGECPAGCCDEFKCPKCGYRLRVECPQ